MKTTRLLAGSAALCALSAATRPAAIAGTVRADVSDPKAMIGQLQAAFEEFKKTNDEKLSAKADVVLDEKVQRIDAAVANFQGVIDDLNAKIAAGPANPGADRVQDPEYTKTWAGFFRDGDRSAEDTVKAAQKSGVYAAMTVGTNADGGYFAPVEWDRTLTGRLKEVSPIRQNATVQTISGPGFRKLFNDRNIGSGWVGETASRPATSTPQISPLDFAPGELYAFPFASQTLLEDSEVDIENWLAGEVETEFSKQENIAFLSGDGVNKPHGLLTYVTGGTNAARHPWGAIGVVNSGAAAAMTADAFINLFYSIPAANRVGAKLYTNRLTQSGMRKLKDGQGNYLWQPSFAAGQPATLGGESIVEVPDMPDVAAGAIAALYGNMAATYLVVDRLGIQVIRDALTNKPFVGFYTRKRVGGGVQNPDTMKALKIAA